MSIPPAGSDDRTATDLDGVAPQFAAFPEEGTGGIEQHPEEVTADRAGEPPLRGQAP